MSNQIEPNISRYIKRQIEENYIYIIIFVYIIL